MTHPTYRFDGWTFDAGRRSVRNPAGEIVALTPKDFALLRIFLDRPQQYLSREFLVDAVYGKYPPTTCYTGVNTCVSRLRAKIDDRIPGAPKIVAVPGGYWFCPAPEIVEVQHPAPSE